MCVMKWESLVGGCFWENRKLLFGKTESLGWKCKNFDFLHICKPQIYSQLSICPHQIFSFHRTNITCNFPFYRLLAAASPSTNRPKSKSGYLAIVSLKHGRLVRVRSQYSPVSAVSDTSKLATGNFWRVRAFAVQPPFRTGSKPESCFRHGKL